MSEFTRLGTFFFGGVSIALGGLIGKTLYDENKADHLTHLQSQPVIEQTAQPQPVIQHTIPTIEHLLEQPIEQTSQDLQTHYNITISPQELVYMTRMVYHEGLDRKAQLTGNLDQALAVVAHNIWDRHNWDSTHTSVFSGPNLEDIMFSCKSQTKKGKPTNCQYSAFHWHNKDFQSATEDSKYKLKTGKMNDRRTQQAYRVILETITGEDHDLPEEILYYTNPSLIKKMKGKEEIKDGNDAFTYANTSCNDIKLPKTSKALKGAEKTKCRVEEQYHIDKLDSIYSHDIFTAKPTRTEYVWHDSEFTKQSQKSK